MNEYKLKKINEILRCLMRGLGKREEESAIYLAHRIIMGDEWTPRLQEELVKWKEQSKKVASRIYSKVNK